MAFTASTEALIRALQHLPGIGTRSAQRMALHLLERDTESAEELSSALQEALEKVHRCPSCRTLTESPVCETCNDSHRDTATLCVVMNDADRSAMEMSNRYKGKYFVLHGVLSPIDGVGPEQLGIFDLIDKVAAENVEEVIFALDEQMESEATVYYISQHLKSKSVRCSRLHFNQMKNGSFDQADSHQFANALKYKEEISLEQD